MKKIAFFAVAASCLLLAPRSGFAQAFIGLQTGGLGLSSYTAPGTTPASYTVAGTSGGEALVGIDLFTNGQLFGMGGSGTLYTLAQTSATAFTATVNTTLGTAGVTTIDFNPTASRLRVYAGTSNFRLTPGTGAVTPDGTLAYNTGDVNFGATPALRAAAYTNNFAGAASTALYSLDTTADALILNTGSPAFSGLTTVATLTLSGVRFDIVPGNTGFDITAANAAYITSGSTLYTVNLTSGVLTLVGTQSGTALIDVAFVPEPGTWAMMVLGGLGLAVYTIRRRQGVTAF